MVIRAHLRKGPGALLGELPADCLHYRVKTLGDVILCETDSLRSLQFIMGNIVPSVAYQVCICNGISGRPILLA